MPSISGEAQRVIRIAFGDKGASDEIIDALNTDQFVDDDTLALGTSDDVELLWETADANANEMLIEMPAGTATNVPVIVVAQGHKNVDLGLHNGIVDPTLSFLAAGAVTTASVIELRKARGSVASPTACTSGDDLGTINFYGCVAAAEYVQSASIRADIAGTVATTRGPGNLSFNVATDAAPSVLTERILVTGSGLLTLTPATDVVVANGTGLIVGHTSQLTVAGVAPELQVLGTTTGVDGSMVLLTASTTNGDQSQLIIGKGGNAALGSFTTVAQSESLGAITWVGDDGTDYATVAARIGAAVNASGTVATSRIPTDLFFSTDPGGADDAIAEQMRLGCTGILFIGDNSNANMTKGLCLNQGTADNQIFSAKSSDVAHAATALAEADTYLCISKFEATTGGGFIQGFKDGDGSVLGNALVLEGVLDEAAADTTKSTAGVGIVNVICSIEGTNTRAATGADGNLFVVQDGALATKCIIDAEGSQHGDAAAATYDEHDDWALIRAYDQDKKGYIKSRWDEFVGANKQDLVDMGIIGKCKGGIPGERPLVNFTKLQQLHNGAIGQLGAQLYDLVYAIASSKTLDEVKEKLPGILQSRLEAAKV